MALKAEELYMVCPECNWIGSGGREDIENERRWVDSEEVIHKELFLLGETVYVPFYVEVLERLRQRVNRACSEIANS